MEALLRSTPSRALADEWALALTADAIAVRVDRAGRSFELRVFERDLVRAEAILVALDHEREGVRRRAEELRARASYDATSSLWAPIACGSALLLGWAASGPRSAGSDWFERGEADGGRILAGELWRCVTALMLHADVGHLFGNLVFGAFFVYALSRSCGPGVSLALALASGFAGNALNALVRGTAMHSVGASTAVFGVVGCLTGGAVMRRDEDRRSLRRRAAPIAAGLGLLAWIGTEGERTDIWAHAFGLGAGTMLGALFRIGRSAPARTSVQITCALASAAAVVASWAAALGE